MYRIQWGLSLRIKIAAALFAAPLASASNAQNLFAACSYNNDQGSYSLTPLFILKGDALPADGAWTYEKTLQWEQQIPGEMRGVSSYTPSDFVGQFISYAEKAKTEGGSSQALCLITTDKQRAQAFHKKKVDDGRFEESLLKGWRPTKDSFVGVESWSGTPLGSGASAQPAEESMPPGGSESGMVAKRLQSEREEAARRAASIALVMKNDVELEAGLKKLLEELRKRCGSAKSTACSQ